MKTAKEIAASWNRMLLEIYNGENSEYESLVGYLGGMEDTEVQYVQQQDRRSQYYVGVVLALAGGGPTVWLNTADGNLYASDSGECYGVGLFSEVRDEINDIFGIEY